jgi:hypothetical protein
MRGYGFVGWNALADLQIYRFYRNVVFLMKFLFSDGF